MGSTLLSLVLFVLVACGMTAAVNRVFGPVSRPILLMLTAAVALFMLAVPTIRTGPSSLAARAQIVTGEVPLWDGEPLLANPRLALGHPFTLLACLANTPQLAVALRLFAALLFAFVLLRAWGIGDAAALFGAVGYAFCTTQTVSTAALTIAMLPLALAATQEHARAPRLRTLATLTVALALVILAGDLPVALRVWVAAAAYLLFLVWRPASDRRSNALADVFPLPPGAGRGEGLASLPAAGSGPRTLLTAVIAFLFAAGLTAFFWMPLRDITPHIARSVTERDWSQLLTLLAPNVLGTTGSGYAGIITLVLAAIGLLRSDRRERWFFIAIALLGFWPMSLCALAALGVCALTRNTVSPRTFRIAAGCVAFALLTVWFARAEYLDVTFAWTQALISFIALALFALVGGEWRILPGLLAAVLTFSELTLVAQQAKPEPTHFDNARYARLKDEAPDTLARFAKTPPAFVVSHYGVQAEIGDVLPRLPWIMDLGAAAIVHDVPPSIAQDAPQLARGGVSAPRNVRLRAQNGREVRIDVAGGTGWSLLVTHQVDWPGWRGYWNGQRQPVVTVDGAFAGAFIPPGPGTLVLRYWPAAFVDGVRVSLFTLLMVVIALTLRRMWSKIGDRPV